MNNSAQMYPLKGKKIIAPPISGNLCSEILLYRIENNWTQPSDVFLNMIKQTYEVGNPYQKMRNDNGLFYVMKQEEMIDSLEKDNGKFSFNWDKTDDWMDMATTIAYLNSVLDIATYPNKTKPSV